MPEFDAVAFGVCDPGEAAVVGVFAVRIDGDETKTGPPRISKVDIMSGITLERPVLRYGIMVRNVRYASQELGELRRRLARSNARNPLVVLKSTPGDGCIHVLDPQAKTYLKVPAVNQE